jgi:hypothetical protein
MTAGSKRANRPIHGTISPMRTRIEHFTPDLPDVVPPTRRLSRESAALLVLALLCASATIAFGIWMTTWAQHL